MVCVAVAMASVRFMSIPSTTYLSSDLQNPLFSLVQKPHNLSLSLSHFHRRSPLVLKFSATAQAHDVAPRKVSTTKLVIQNIPWEATAEDVRTLAEQYGTVVDVEVSMHNKTKNRGIAFVSFSTAEEARAALNNLKEFNGRAVIAYYAHHPQRKSPLQTKPPVPLTFNLFVANLPFSANNKDLKEFFEAEYDSVHSADIIYHQNPRQPAGYGFVAFKTKKHADAALTAFQGKMFMGRPLRLNRRKPFVGERKKEESVKTYDDSSAESNSDAQEH